MNICLIDLHLLYGKILGWSFNFRGMRGEYHSAERGMSPPPFLILPPPLLGIPPSFGEPHPPAFGAFSVITRANF